MTEVTRQIVLLFCVKSKPNDRNFHFYPKDTIILVMHQSFVSRPPREDSGDIAGLKCLDLTADGGIKFPANTRTH